MSAVAACTVVEVAEAVSVFAGAARELAGAARVKSRVEKANLEKRIIKGVFSKKSCIVLFVAGRGRRFSSVGREVNLHRWRRSIFIGGVVNIHRRRGQSSVVGKVKFP